MDQSLLSSRAIIGMYYARLEANPGLWWVNQVSNFFPSDQISETYPFLGQSPAMRLWVGGRNVTSPRQNSRIVTNAEYEASIEVAVRDAKRDKSGQIRARIEDLADRDLSHWASLLSTLIENGTSETCYDGQYYFDTDHSEGDSGTQDNDITVDISGLPNVAHGSVTVPSKEELQWAIMKTIAQILSFKDDQGEPMNENATSFLVMVPTSLYMIALAAVELANNREVADLSLQAQENTSVMKKFNIDVAQNARSTWTDSFAVFRTDSPIKGLIRQAEGDSEMKAKAEGSEFEFDNNAWQFGINASRAVDYGYWQRACYCTMT